MTKQEQKTAPTSTQTKSQERSPARAKDENRNDNPGGKDMPGAEGPLSAGAEEDTYD